MVSGRRKTDTTEVKRENSKCVAMLVDEEFLLKNELQLNPIGCYLYETDKHGSPIMGNILFVGDTYTGDHRSGNRAWIKGLYL